jgi:localization factor PodJL
MHDLAVAYAEGLGGVKSPSEAVRWFARAASLGYVDSEFNLAVLYERGDGVPQSLVDAFKWYAIAGAQGDAESKLRLDALRTQLSAEDLAAAQRAADAFHPLPLNQSANFAPKI